MKIKATILGGILIIFCGCFAQEKRVTFINDSGLKVDSAYIAVSSKEIYTIQLIDVYPGDTLFNIIPANVPESNKHDITLSITVFIKNHKPIYEYSYNDLVGYLNHSYTILLNENMKLEWQVDAREPVLKNEREYQN